MTFCTVSILNVAQMAGDTIWKQNTRRHGSGWNIAAGKSKSVGDLGVGGSGLCSSRKRRIFFSGHLFKMQLKEEKGRRAGSEICVCNRMCVWRSVLWNRKAESISFPPSLHPQGDDLGLELRVLCILLPHGNAFHPFHAFLNRSRES